MVSITAPRLPTVGTGPGSLPARVTGPRQNQNHQPGPVLAARAPRNGNPGQGGKGGALQRPNAAASGAASVLNPTERARKSLERSHEQADPLDQLTADLTSLSMQHAAAMQQMHAPHAQAGASHAGPRSAMHNDAGLPPQLAMLQDPRAPVALPPPGSLPRSALDNWKLDKLVGQLGKDKATWRRALMLFEWLRASTHQMDDRLCTTLIRVCSDHGDCVSALAVYDWMTSSPVAGGAALTPTTYTYTAAMRAALAGHLHSRGLQVWNDAWRQHQAGQLALDARLCITYVELCARMGLTDQALGMYSKMLAAPPHSRMAPTVHAFTAAMRAATEGGRWTKALEIWEDMRRAGCEPSGHAYAAAISACAAGSDWLRAVAFFEEMAGRGIKPDVVSCTALISALATAGEADKAENVVAWMLANGVRPNARTYTALLSALANAQQWTRALETLSRMRQPEWGGVEPNAYTYSALLKSLGEHGQWQVAEAVFSGIERQLLGGSGPSGPAPAAAAAALNLAAAVRMEQPQEGGALSAVASSRDLASHELSLSVSVGTAGSTSSGSAGPSGMATPVAADSAARSWTRPSQLHGLNLDLHAAAGAAAAAGAVSSEVALSASSCTHGHAPLTGGPAAEPAQVQYTNRRSFSLFSHPAGSASPSTDGSAGHPVGTSAATAAVAAYPASHAQAPSPAQLSRDPWRLALDQASAQPLVAQLSQHHHHHHHGAPSPPPPPAGAPQRQQPHGSVAGASGRGMPPHGGPEVHIVNEVVCGALMLAYERAGKWQEAVNVLMRAVNLGIHPNTVMYNTAISAAGKAGQLEVAERLYAKVRSPDAVTHETMIAAYGVAGLAEKAEGVFSAMTASGMRPRDYAYCGLIAAHSLSGDWEGALRVRARMLMSGVQPSVHVYNALLAACERTAQPDRALELLAAMKREGVDPNAVTQQLLSAVGRQGVQSVENQQVAAAALSAAFAAYGTLLIQTGAF